MKLYARRNPWDLEPHYSRHVAAMTAEALHEKAAIACELAWRDAEIERLGALVEGDHELSRLLVEKRHGSLGASVEVAGPAFVALAAESRAVLDGAGAKNFVEIQFTDDRGQLSLVIQRYEGETPATQCGRLRSENATLRSTIRSLLSRVTVSPQDGTGGWVTLSAEQLEELKAACGGQP